MKKALLAVSSLIFVAVSNLAFAEDNHTANFCSLENPAVCAHLGHFDKLSASTPAEFMAHVLTPNNEPTTDMEVQLWINLGDGTGRQAGPVTLKQVDVNKYWVSDAKFFSEGFWDVDLNFKLNGVQHQISIHVDVEP